MSKPTHVLISGGGLAGGSLALCLARHRIKSTIFERRQHPGSTGGSITLAANALRALDQYVGVYPEIKKSGYVHDGFQAYLSDGYKLGEIGLGDGGYPAIRIMRSKVHEILMNKCKDQGEWITWESGKNVVGVHEHTEGVEVELDGGERVSGGSLLTPSHRSALLLHSSFANGSAQSGRRKLTPGDILVGADGVNSVVRQHVLSSLGRPNPTPDYIGTCIVVTYISRKLLDLSQDLRFPYMFFCPSGQVQITTTSPDPTQGDLSLVITRKFAPRSPGAWKTLATSGEAARLAVDDYKGATVEPLRTVLKHVDPTKSDVWAPYTIPDIGEGWSTKRVVLIGDAAHALPPNGQGTAMAFEDAAFLARCLVEGQRPSENYNDIFKHFTQVRRSRVDGLREKNLPTVISWVKDSVIPGPIIWWIKSWVFSAFFYFQGGTVHMKGIHDYDVSKESAVRREG